MAFRQFDLDRIRRMIEVGEQRIAAQEDLIERLRAKGYPTTEAEDFLRAMQELRTLQLGLRTDMEWLAKKERISI